MTKAKLVTNMWALSEWAGVPKTGPEYLTEWYETEEIGPKVSEERKEELRQSMKGNTWNRGRKLTEEHKEKIRQANYKREYPKGDAVRERMIQMAKGNNNRGKRCMFEGVEYKSVADAVRATGIPKSTLHRKVTLLD